MWIANKSFGTVPAKIDRAITNVVMMGMGEPLLNFDNVVAAMNIMMDDLGYGISKRKVTLSTSGVVPMIDKLGEVIDVSWPCRCTHRTTSCATSWCRSTRSIRWACCWMPAAGIFPGSARSAC